MIPYMTTRLRTAVDDVGDLFFVNITTGGYGMRIEIGNCSQLYVAALLNSNLLDFCVRQNTNMFRGGYFAANKQAVENLPIRTIDFSDRADVKRHDAMVSLVQRMLDLNKRLAKAKPGHARTVLEREVAATDRRIDELVYELYGLTDREVRIVEEATKD